MPLWSYDFGDVTLEKLAELKPEDFSNGVEKARDAAVSLIEAGAVDEAGSYRVVVRADGGAPQGLLLEVRPTLAPVTQPVPPQPPAPAPQPAPQPAPAPAPEPAPKSATASDKNPSK